MCSGSSESTVIQPQCCGDNFSLLLFKVFLIGTSRLIYVYVLSLCGAIIYFHLTVVSTQLQFTKYISWGFFHHVAGGSRRQEDKELVEFLWMADFIVTSRELDSFADC